MEVQIPVILNRVLISSLKIDDEFRVDSARGEIVGHRILGVVDVAYPKVRNRVADAENVEDFAGNPNSFQPLVEYIFVLSPDGVPKLSAEADVYSAIRRQGEFVFVAVVARWAGRQTGGKDHTQMDFNEFELRDIILKEHGKANRLIGGAIDIAGVNR